MRIHATPSPVVLLASLAAMVLVVAQPACFRTENPDRNTRDDGGGGRPGEGEGEGEPECFSDTDCLLEENDGALTDEVDECQQCGGDPCVSDNLGGRWCAVVEEVDLTCDDVGADAFDINGVTVCLEDTGVRCRNRRCD